MYELIILLIYLSVLIISSLVAFILFYKDKRLSINNDMRIKERTLLGLTSFGGALGAFLGRIIFHHKTNKLYFSFIIYLSLALQLALAAILVLVVLK